MINLFKQIFTWWNKQTLGTFIYTLVKGKFVGQDQFGNKYYSDAKDKKRWVIYDSIVESSKIAPEWHLWIHYLAKNIPSTNISKFNWQKKYVENLTGTPKAYKPDGSLHSNSKKNVKKYETWNS